MDKMLLENLVDALHSAHHNAAKLAQKELLTTTKEKLLMFIDHDIADAAKTLKRIKGES